MMAYGGGYDPLLWLLSRGGSMLRFLIYCSIDSIKVMSLGS